LNKSLAILDSSVAIYTLIITEHTKPAFALVEQLIANEVALYAPRLWIFEVISGINKYRHTRQISLTETEKAVEKAYQLGVNLIDDTPELCKIALRWAERLGQMAAYDGFYLAAAESMDAPLWTGDRRLFNGAREAGADFVHCMEEEIY
jgi:predicted nucleic acid-binding protein